MTPAEMAAAIVADIEVLHSKTRVREEQIALTRVHAIATALATHLERAA